jgi:RHS repeat-associated protein
MGEILRTRRGCRAAGLRLLIASLAVIGAQPAIAQFCGNYDMVVGWKGSFGSDVSATVQNTTVPYTLTTVEHAGANLILSAEAQNANTCQTTSPNPAWSTPPSAPGSVFGKGISNYAWSMSETALQPCVAPPPPDSQSVITGSAASVAGLLAGTVGFSVQFGPKAFIFSPSFTIACTETDTSCSGTVSSYPVGCPVPAQPTAGAYPSFVLPQSTTQLNGATTYQGTDTYLFAPVPVSLSFTLTPIWDDGVDDPCRVLKYSTLGCQNQTLAEDVPVVGTGFALHYQSDRIPGRAAANAAATAQSKMIGGWTLSVHHTLDTASGRLYFGNGGMRSAWQLGSIPVSSGTNQLIASQDGSEVYVFSSTGQHLQTLTPLIGAVIYQFGYDSAGNLVTVTDGSGNVTTIQRDASENATAIVGPFGQTTTLTQDANGFTNKITDPAGAVANFTYDANGLMLSRTDPRGFVYTYAYDDAGRIISESDPAGAKVTVARTDALNLSSTSSGSPGSYTVTRTDPMGEVTTYLTNVLRKSGAGGGDSGTVTWPNGLTPTHSRTQQSIVSLAETTTLPGGSSDSITTGPDPRWLLQVPIPASATYTRGSLVMATTASRVATVGSPLNPFTLTSQTDTSTINGNTSQSVFTAATNTHVATSPVGRTQTLVTDTLERPVTIQIPGLADTTLAYDPQGRLASATQGTRVAKYAYDSAGRLSTFTDPLGRTSSFTYDADGRLLSKTLPDGRVIGFAYDTNGNRTSVTPPGGSPYQFAYSSLNLASSYLPPTAPGTAATSTAYQYDLDRRLTQILRPDAATIALSYDSAGRTSSVVTATATISYAYDTTTGNLASANVGAGEGLAYTYNGPLPVSATWTGAVAGSVSLTYDNNFRIVGETVGTSGAVAVSLGYDADGLLSGVQAGTGSMSLTRSATNGFLTGTALRTVADTFAYDQYGELTGYSASAGSALYSYTNTYDALGRVSARSETIAGTTTQYTYLYDLAGRLTGVSNNGARVSEYRYDANSNRTLGVTASGVARGRYDKQDRMMVYGHAHYAYTANGELASKSEGSAVTRYTYDVLGNLTDVSISPTNTTITYIIDAENRRVGKKVNGVLAAGYLYDGDRIVAQLDSSNAFVSQFVYASRSTSPAFMIKAGVVYRILSDQLGSVRLVVNAATGAIAQRIDYDEFGVVLTDTSPGFQPFGFAGGLYDADTGLLRFGARDYAAYEGRWTTRDPLLFAGGDSNLYRYAFSDPLDRSDTSGLGGGIGFWWGVSAETGISFGAGAQLTGGAAVFWGGQGDCGSLTAGGYSSYGGFVGALDQAVDASPGPSGTHNGVIGASAGAGGGLYFTNGNGVSDISGNSDTTNFALGPLSISISTSGKIWQVTVGLTAGPPGASYSGYRTTTAVCDVCEATKAAVKGIHGLYGIP